MFGSIFYNCWIALLAFTIYFFVTLSQSQAPSSILIGSFVVAIVIFFVMFAVRYFLAYILYTPEQQLFDNLTKDVDREESEQNQQLNNELQTASNTSTLEFKDENSEDIAQVVRTMMSQDDIATNS